MKNLENVSGPGLDDWLCGYLAAWGIRSLTDIQEKALMAGIADGRSMVVSAPTSSGKTLIGEIAVLVALRSGARAVYLVSHKALAEQKYADFQGRFGNKAQLPLATVALSTGDREDGEVNAPVLVTTYEKAFSLLLAGRLMPNDALVVADELQILGERGRGPDIEALCTILRQRTMRQFVALSATIENPDDLAGWMNCALVRSNERDVPLRQEIWFDGKAHCVVFGQDTGEDVTFKTSAARDVVGAVSQLLALGRGPVLVFTESRRESAQFAAAFARDRPRGADGLALGKQLELFSEPTESSESLRDHAERRVAFHSADLTPQEKHVVETGFLTSKFDACFSTSTLAAGVNFPFRSVLIAKITFEWGDRAGTMLTRSDYRNMSGRAGRLGMHDDGFALLLPRTVSELRHANSLVLPQNDRLMSQILSLSLRKTILVLVASKIAGSLADVMRFFENTLYWHQMTDRNPTKLKGLESQSDAALQWLAKNHLVQIEDSCITATTFGQVTALTGLLPTTAVQFADILRRCRGDLATSFDDFTDGLIYAACACAEFQDERPTRFLPWPSVVRHEAVAALAGSKHVVDFDRTNLRLAQCAYGLVLFVKGESEREIAHATCVASGGIHRLAQDVAWVLEGAQKLAAVPDLECSQQLGNKLASLARRVRFGTPVEALDILRTAEEHGVPGFGRQRAMALLRDGIVTLRDLSTTAKDRLVKLLRSEVRADALIKAVNATDSIRDHRLSAAHVRFAKTLGLAEEIAACNRAIGHEYEDTIEALLARVPGWEIIKVDDGKRQNAPDFLIRVGKTAVLLECKTVAKPPRLVDKEDAWAVIQKAADFDKSLRRATLAKPGVDETCKSKVAACDDITLVEHEAFLEGALRVVAGTLVAEDFLKWLGTPGLAELGRLGGRPTYLG